MKVAQKVGRWAACSESPRAARWVDKWAVATAAPTAGSWVDRRVANLVKEKVDLTAARRAAKSVAR